MNVARSSLLRFLADGFGMVVKTVGLFYFANFLGPGPIGTFFLFQATMGIVVQVTDLDISDAVAKRVSEGSDVSATFWTAAVMKLTPLAALAIAILTHQSQVNQFLGANLAFLLVIQVVVSNFAKLSTAILEGELRVGETSLPSVARHTTSVGAGLAFLWSGFGVVGLVYGLVLGSLIRLAIVLSRASIGISPPSIGHARSLFEFFKYSFVSSASSHVFNWTDVLLLGILLTQTAVGVYEIPWRVTAFVVLLSMILSNSIFPQISEWNAEGRSSRIKRLISGSFAVSLFLVVPSFVGTLVLGRDILLLVFGQEYVRGWTVLVIVAGIRIVEAVDVIFRSGLRALNQPRLSAWSEAIALVFNVVLNVLFIWQFGILGAAIASFVAVTAKTMLNGWFFSQFLRLSLPYRRVGAILLASLGMGLVISVVNTTVTVRNLWGLSGMIATGVVVYGIFSLSLSPLRSLIVDNVQRLIA